MTGPALLLAALLLSPDVEREAVSVPVARLSYAEPGIQRSGLDGKASALSGGGPIRTGDRLVTGPGAVARVEFPWMAIGLGPSTTVSLAPSRILAVRLDQGRLVVESDEETVPILTVEAAIRGRGTAVIRRHQVGTTITVLDGSFTVNGETRSLTVAPGEAARVPTPGAAPALVTPPPPPTKLLPGGEVVYAKKGELVTLGWDAPQPTQILEVLGLSSNEVLISREVGPPPITLPLAWAGTYRWRIGPVSAEDVEGVPSTEGLICVLDF